ncbi:NAD-dependent epimerase/dehydratase family protein [Elizabethkingia argentiflava]|uniref:NAD-dependent epimerase/dehydratase family protein n=1 Tax=Elizabethkingia argenteiflava TaxID=2681556 RepID=A0A845PWP7_9FLAO|nr:GDP-mannose 4,6-dehydratase [Elizabethkingia argenteiflava]NAW52274.1 NAD-dependent epimerase/dehydratase family protein [Elizabethkingia argenteiflava]
MNYLVTGGSGFIGSHLVEKLLREGHFVVNVDNFDSFYDYRIKIYNTLESIGDHRVFDFHQKDSDINKLIDRINSDIYKIYYQDIRNFNELRKIFERHSFDMVIHLAALAGVRPSIERPLEYQQVNIQGSLHLWELCREFGIRKFICASSSSVYGNNKKVPFAESDVVDQPISPYAATKKSGEILGHVYHALYQLDMLQLRFFTVYGPRQRPDLAIHKFAELMWKQEKIPFYGDGTTARDYTYIDDIIDGIMKSVEYLHHHEGVYEILNLGENQVVTLQEMLDTLSATLKVHPDLQSLPLQAGDVQRTNANIQKAKELIGYCPKTNFQTGIKIFVEWFLSNKKNKKETDQGGKNN